MILTQTEGVGIGQDVDVARALFDRGDYSEAAGLARLVFDCSDNVDEKVRALLLLSSCESERGRLRKAVAVLDLASPFLDSVAPRQKANFYGQRAYLHTKLGNDDSSLIDYEAARLYAHEAADKVIEAQIRNNLAGCYRRANRFDEALVESDAAIAIARHQGERVLLGRFYDQKAQILIDLRRYTEAVKISRQALEMLGEHPSSTEARATHAHALMSLGLSCLETEDPVETYCAKRAVMNKVKVPVDANLIQLVLDRVGGHVSQAAHLLGVSHPTLIETIKRHRLTRQEPQRRLKSYTRKINPMNKR